MLRYLNKVLPFPLGLVVIALPALFSCENTRDFEMCAITETGTFMCSDGSKEFERTLMEMHGYICSPKHDITKIAERLEACEAGNGD